MIVVARCSMDAAKHAVMNWHYSRRMPSGRLVKFGVWENEQFIGVVLFGRGANDRMLQPYGLKQSEGCELVRVALREHDAPVSQIVAEALRQLKRTNPGLRLVVSYADPSHGHHGGIYQAGNWLYLGEADETREFMVRGKQVHERTVSSWVRTHENSQTRHKRSDESRENWLRRVYDPKAHMVYVRGKHRYVMPLDKQMRRLLVGKATAFPHAVEGSTVIRSASGRQG